jgi:hypothetical protein
MEALWPLGLKYVKNDVTVKRNLSTAKIYGDLSRGGFPMSILSTLALLSTALVARSQPLEKRVEELELELEDMKAQRDSAREDAARWEALSVSWQRRYETTDPYRQHQMAQAALQQQYAMMQGQAAQNQMLGAQTLGFDGFCNCVPSRTQVWEASRS